MMKRGESLVEVIVSCGVLILVFTGVLSLLMQAVNLNLGSRSRTEAIAEAQTQLTNFVVSGRVDTQIDTIPVSNTNLDSGSCLISTSGSPYTPGESINTDVSLHDSQCKLNKDNGTLYNYLSGVPNNRCHYTTIENLDTEVEKLDPLVTPSYQKVVVHVLWTSRGLGVQEFDLSELVRSQ